MTGVLYWTFGMPNLERLAVSLYSLRQVYGGPVCILHEGPLPQHCRYYFWSHNASLIELPENNEYVFLKKARIWKHSPFDATLYLDSDTVVLKPIDEIMRYVSAHKLVLARHPTFGPENYGRIKKRLEPWRRIFPEMHRAAIGLQTATNTGVVGWTSKQSMQDAEAVTEVGYEAGTPMRRIIDEMALTLVGARDACFVDSTWNYCPPGKDLASAHILHFYNGKHKDSPIWKEWRERVKV